ncbi:MAG: long-chain-acyl-CoA synthetase [Myxococcales bacterium]|nr:long-chain-acyl-CoA synthetase [Myxococcales bacterium]
MGLKQRLRSTWIELEATGRLLPHLHRVLPGSHWHIARIIARNAERFGNHTALRYLEESYSWQEFEDRLARYAGYLRRKGIKQGDVVALMMDNRPDFLFIEAAVCRLGAISALINTNLIEHALVHAINIGHPKLVIGGSEHALQLRQVAGELCVKESEVLVQLEHDDDDAQGFATLNADLGKAIQVRDNAKTKPDDGMCYIYTSGTTGLPKAAIVTHKRFLLAAHLFGRSIHDAAPDDVIYATLPLYHSNAQWAGFGASVTSAGTLALRRKFSASQFWDDVRKFGATHFIYIGELCRYLLNQPPNSRDRDHQLRGGTGNGLRPDIWEAFTSRFGVPVMREFYGATEGNAPMFNIEGKPGMVGRLRPGQIIVKCDLSSGEVLRNAQGLCEEVEVGGTGLFLGKINAVTRFDGYVDNQATQKKVITDVLKHGDTYFNSGDLLTLNEDKWVAFADRVGDTFRWKGENVSTNEVAEVLNAAPGVLESNVYGVQVTGTDGRAGMASLNTDEQFDLGAFAAFVIDKLPGYQRPYFIRVQDGMRITGTFKHQKVDYRKEGYDPTQVNGDALYYLDGERYVPIDAELHQKLVSGEVSPR